MASEATRACLVRQRLTSREHSSVRQYVFSSCLPRSKHRLVVHGLVRRPLVFTLEALHRYPMQSRIAFIECAGNSQVLNAPQPQQAGITVTHGLLGCSEWTGVKLSTLLDEAGVDPPARWVIAEGADAAGMSRSIPIGAHCTVTRARAEFSRCGTCVPLGCRCRDDTLLESRDRDPWVAPPSQQGSEI